MNNQKLLICSDLDRTIIPNGEQPESPNVRILFKELVSHNWATLAYVSGRDQLLVKEAISTYDLPMPNFVIADVGSTIYQIKNNQWLRLTLWDQKLTQTWHYLTASDLEGLFLDLKGCRLQETEKQGLHKLSYYVDLEIDRADLLETVKLRLAKEKIEANLIWSIDEQAQIGLLDILPISANKRLAIEFLMNQQNFTLENTVFAGDSGNDLDVLISPIKSILVANAPPELKSIMLAKLKENQDLGNSFYLAQGNYLKMNGNYCAGILEGVNYYFPQLVNQI